MTPKEFVDFVKEQTSYGDVGTYGANDRPTQQILARGNENFNSIAAEYPFTWLFGLISFQISKAGGQVYGIGSNIRKVLLLRIGSTILKRKGIRTFYDRFYDGDQTPAKPAYYIDQPLSSGNLQIRLEPVFTDTSTVDGVGFLRITEMAAADLSGSAEISVFPSDVHRIAAWMTCGDIHDLRRETPEAVRDWAKAERMLQTAVRDDKFKPDQIPELLLPERLLVARRLRRGSRTGVYL